MEIVAQDLLVRCRLEGNLTDDAMRGALSGSCRESLNRGKGVLCDVRNTSFDWSYPQIYDFVASRNYGAAVPLLPACRIAIVCRNDIESARWDFLAMTAQHRGLGVKVFFDPALAEAWLTEGR